MSELSAADYALKLMRARNVPTRLLDDAVAELLARAWERFSSTDPHSLERLASNVARDVYWGSVTPLSGLSPSKIYKAVRAGEADHLIHSVSLSEPNDYDVPDSGPVTPAPEHPAVIEAVQRLKPSQREVIELLYYTPAEDYSGVGRPSKNLSPNGLTHSAAARRLGITEAAVRSREKNAIRNLRKDLSHA